MVGGFGVFQRKYTQLKKLLSEMRAMIAAGKIS